MDKETLVAKRNAIVKEFEEQGRVKNNAETRQVQLQGEHRLVQELIEMVEQEKAASSELITVDTDDVTTITKEDIT